jgi:sphinganine-1-phosphate aldolase
MSQSLARSPQFQQAQILTSKVAHSVLFYVVYRHIILAGYRHMRARGVIGSVQEIIDAGKDVSLMRTNQKPEEHSYRFTNSYYQFVIGLLLQLPSSKQKIATELGAARDGIEEKLVPRKLPEGSTYVNALPKKGKTPDWLNEEMERLLSMEKNDVQEGRVSGAVYHVSSSSWFSCGLRRSY